MIKSENMTEIRNNVKSNESFRIFGIFCHILHDNLELKLKSEWFPHFNLMPLVPVQNELIRSGYYC